MPAKWDSAALTQAIQRLPGQMRDNVARGAARAFAKPIVEDARQRCHDKEVADGLKVTTRLEGAVAIARIQTSGPGAYKAPWLEYGTLPHFIAVDERDREGRSVGRINRLNKQADQEGSLRIGGNFVGPVVHHPGESKVKYRFLRPAVDTQTEAGFDAAVGYIAARISTGDLDSPAPSDEAQP